MHTNTNQRCRYDTWYNTNTHPDTGQHALSTHTLVTCEDAETTHNSGCNRGTMQGSPCGGGYAQDCMFSLVSIQTVLKCLHELGFLNVVHNLNLLCLFYLVWLNLIHSVVKHPPCTCSSRNWSRWRPGCEGTALYRTGEGDPQPLQKHSSPIFCYDFAFLGWKDKDIQI